MKTLKLPVFGSGRVPFNMQMKNLITLLIFCLTFPAFSSADSNTPSIICGSTSCVPSSMPGAVTVLEKAGFSAVDAGTQGTAFSVLAGQGPTAHDIRLNVSNGAFPGKALTVNLSSNLAGKDSGSIMVFADNIDALNVSLNGYTGSNGIDASQLCASKILSGQYGDDAKAQFLSRRGTTTANTVDRCTQQDLDDLAASRFTCSDPTFKPMDSGVTTVPVTEIRQVNRCSSGISQNLCYQKSYTITCNYRLGINNYITGNQPNGRYDQLYAYAKTRSCEGGCTRYDNPAGECGIAPEFTDHYSNGWAYNWNNFYAVDANGNKTATSINRSYSKVISQTDYDNLVSSYGTMDSICQSFADTDAELKRIKTKDYALDYVQLGKFENNVLVGGIFAPHFEKNCDALDTHIDYHTVGTDGTLSWIADQNSPTNQLIQTSPGLTSSNQKLVNGTDPFTPVADGSLESNNDVKDAQGNVTAVGWRIRLMPAFSACSAHYTYISKIAETITKNVYDPAEVTAQSFYCVNPLDDTNCSINKPYCDNPIDDVTQNCKHVSACAKINRKLCTNMADRTNCTQPPFCDDSTSSVNCSSTQFSKSCDISDPSNSSCDQDPNNLATFTPLSTVPDPSIPAQTVTVACGVSNCPIPTKTVEVTTSVDTLVPTDGQSGTLQGQGLFFVYDIRSIVQSALVGQAGTGGKSDLNIVPQVRYCSLIKDYTSDPGTSYENSPSVTFKKVNFTPFAVSSGGNPGTPPSYSSKAIEIYKKLDPSTRFLLKQVLTQ